jgi:hypothetical protein
MSKETEGKTGAGQSTTIKVPDTPKQDTAREGVVSKPLGGLYAGPASGQSASGPQITSTGSMQAPRPTEVDKAAAEQREAQDKEAKARESRAREMAQAKPSEAQKKEIEARKKGAEVLAKHDEALEKAKEDVAKRTPEGKTGHSISPTVRQDEEMAAAKAMGAPKIDLATGEKDRPLRYDPEAPISHSILPTVREDEEMGIVPKDRAVTKEEAEKKTDYDSWVGSNERQQAPNPKPSQRGGEYDGDITVNFRANQGYNYSFGFDLPNVMGTLGIVGLNDDAIRSLIENALLTRFGTGGVVRRNNEKPADFPQGKPPPVPTFSS